MTTADSPVQRRFLARCRNVQTLRKLKPNELDADMHLPGNVYDVEGNVLLRAGRNLTRADKDSLPPRVYTDEEWPSRRSVESAIQETSTRPGVSESVACESRQPRKEWTASLAVTIEQDNGSRLMRREVTVTTRDVSRNGFSFVYRQFVQPGATVKAKFDMLPHQPLLIGVVRNCVLLEGMEHRVGVEFTGAG